jgi:hypothetical protein
MDDLILLQQARTDFLWIKHNAEQLQKYVGEIIAVHGKSVVAHSDDYDELIEQLQSKGVNPNDCLITRVREQNEIVLF